MSYILEALKKAQAERQLGATPGIDAAPMAMRHAAPQQSNLRWIALAVAGLVFGAVAFYMATRPAPAPAPALPAPLAAAAPVVLPVPKAEPLIIPAPAPAPVVSAPVLKPLPVPEAAPEPAPVSRPLPARAEPPKPVVTSTPDPDESLPLLSQLPPEIQQTVPAVSFGGYMYSSNPADRLILIDKVLRKEGDSVAPGLILERLLPKCAVLNYRGTRYRVTY
jgi:general secretion pathway protein B